MVDNLDKYKRSEIMKRVKSRSHLEELVGKALWEYGIRYRKNVKDLFGKPDIAIKKYKIVIFIDSCFWHACPLHGRMPKSNIEYWSKKLERNNARDQKVNQYYRDNNWHIKRIWEHELKEDFAKTIINLANFINSVKKNSSN